MYDGGFDNLDMATPFFYRGTADDGILLYSGSTHGVVNSSVNTTKYVAGLGLDPVNNILYLL